MLSFVMPAVIYKPNGPLPFDPNFRTGNCYTYGLGVKAMGRVKPGQLCEKFQSSTPTDMITINGLIHLLRKDRLIRVRQHSGDRETNQILAGAVHEGTDYHFYRLQPNGNWSHKISYEDPTLYDYSGNVITSPEMANRGNYADFVGYFRIPRSGLRYVV